MQQRLEYFDTLKGFAIFMVIVGHVELSILKSPTIITAIVSLLHIPIFMFISGYLLYNSLQKRQQFKIFVLDKLKRLMVPFVSFIIIYSLLFNIDIQRLLFSEYKYGFWFTLTLFTIMLIVTIINGIIKNNKNPLIFLLCFGGFYIFICFIHFYVTLTYKVDSLLSLSQLIYYYPVFVFGFMLGKYDELYNVLFNNNLIISLSAFVFVICIIFKWFLKYDSLFLLLVSGVSGVIIFNYIFKRNNFSKTFNFLFYRFGKYSLDIYMIHFFYIALFNNLVDFGVFPTYIVLFVMPVVLLLAAYYTGLIIQKIKLINIVLWGKI